MQSISNITAAILAGGLGSRLQSVISDKPKVLAEILGRPFLTYLLDQISSAGAREAVICTGYMAEEVQECFGGAYKSLRLLYSKEEEPLSTGGALRLALPCLSSDIVLVMNGDSYMDTDLSTYVDWFFQKSRDAALLLTQVPDTVRYGRVTVDEDGSITAFDEKGTSQGAGWINAGIYLMKKSLIASIPVGRLYSLEREFFPSLTGKKLFGFCGEGKFIDIGTPKSYAMAADFFAVVAPKNFAGQ